MSIVTALNPYIGYSRAADIAKESSLTGKSIKEVVLGKKLLSEKKLNEILSPMLMTKPGFIKTDNNTEL
jgi:aspartate ammonia-lyase